MMDVQYRRAGRKIAGGQSGKLEDFDQAEMMEDNPHLAADVEDKDVKMKYLHIQDRKIYGCRYSAQEEEDLHSKVGKMGDGRSVTGKMEDDQGLDHLVGYKQDERIEAAKIGPNL